MGGLYKTHTHLPTGSTPVVTTEGVNPETLEKKVDDSLERQAT
jgi:hypothetical protein